MTVTLDWKQLEPVDGCWLLAAGPDCWLNIILSAPSEVSHTGLSLSSCPQNSYLHPGQVQWPVVPLHCPFLQECSVLAQSQLGWRALWAPIGLT